MTEITDFLENYPVKKKRCRKCFKDKALSHFCKNNSNPDGLSSYCRKCKKEYQDRYRKNLKKKNRKKDPFDESKKKICPKCRHSYPKTEIFWYENISQPDGLNVYCRECDINRINKLRSKYKKKYKHKDPYNKRRAKRCRQCEKLLSKTKENWSKKPNNRDGLRGICKVCQKKNRKKIYLKNKEKNLEKKLYNKDEMKRCPTCKQTYPKTEKYWHIKYGNTDGLSSYCRKCKTKIFRRRKYNISIKKQEKLLETQNHKCAICGTSITMKSAHLDHNHRTGKVRGYLCFLCNNMLGLARDNSFILIKATKFLLKERDK